MKSGLVMLLHVLHWYGWELLLDYTCKVCLYTLHTIFIYIHTHNIFQKFGVIFFFLWKLILLFSTDALNFWWDTDLYNETKDFISCSFDLFIHQRIQEKCIISPFHTKSILVNYLVNYLDILQMRLQNLPIFWNWCVNGFYQ